LLKKYFSVLMMFYLLLSATSLCAECLLLQRAEDYKNGGRYLEALSFYRDVSMNSWQQQDESFILNKGMADILYLYLNNTDKALDLYNKALLQLPHRIETAPVYHNLAKLYYKKGDGKRSEDMYRQLFAMFPDYFKKNNIDDEINPARQAKQFPEDQLLSVNSEKPYYVRVLVKDGADKAVVSSDGPINILFSGDPLLTKKEAGRKIFIMPGNASSVIVDGRSYPFSQIILETDPEHFIRLNGSSYRGFFKIYSRQGKLFVVNHVPVEEYLYGVLPREVSPSWPKNALCAQAVAARTYVLYNMIKRTDAFYDVFSTTSSQVYGGQGTEHSSTQKAVDATRGMVLSCDGKIFLALYHSNSGGVTENPESIWGSSIDCLSSVQDEFSGGRPGFSWRAKLSLEYIKQKMHRFGLPPEKIADIVPEQRSSSGRIEKIRIVQESGSSFLLTGNSFRLIVGAGKVKSCNFTKIKKKDKFVFSGSGYGHGAGMSQWGACGMAKKGYDYRKILDFYYKGLILKKIKYGNSAQP